MTTRPRDSNRPPDIPADAWQRIRTAFELAVGDWEIAKRIEYLRSLKARLARDPNQFVESTYQRLHNSAVLYMVLETHLHDLVSKPDHDLISPIRHEFEIPGVDYEFTPTEISPPPSDLDDEWRWGPLLLQFPANEPVLCTPIVADDHGPYAHTFGGAPKHAGVVPEGCEHSLHLIYQLDLRDPRIPVQITDLDWLPLYYPIQYDPSPCFYYVRSNDKIEIVKTYDTQWQHDFPGEGYPRQLPEMRVSLERPRNLEFSEQTQKWFDEEFENHDGPVEQLEIVEWACALYQDAPRSKCINAACNEQAMNLFAIVPSDDIYGMDLYWSEADGRFTYEICPRCHLIRASEQA